MVISKFLSQTIYEILICLNDFNDCMISQSVIAGNFFTSFHIVLSHYSWYQSQTVTHSFVYYIFLFISGSILWSYDWFRLLGLC